MDAKGNTAEGQVEMRKMLLDGKEKNYPYYKVAEYLAELYLL